MVSFQCHTCGDVVKKPKLDQHRARCHGGFDCIDCSTVFNTPAEYKSHTTCISEAEKYQKSLYKGPKTGQKNPQQNSKPVEEVIETPAPAPARKETTHDTPGVRNSNAQWGAPEPVQDFSSNGRSFNAHGRGGFNSYGQQLRTKVSGANDIPLGASKRPAPKVTPKPVQAVNGFSSTSAPKVDFTKQVKKNIAPAPSTSNSGRSSAQKDTHEKKADKEPKKDKKKKETTTDAGDSEGNKKRKRGDADAMEVDAADEDKRRAKEERRRKKKEAKATAEPESAVAEDEGVEVGKKRKRETDNTPADKSVVEEKEKEKKEKKDKKKKAKDSEDAMDVDTPAVDAKKEKKSKDKKKEKKEKSAASL